MANLRNFLIAGLVASRGLTESRNIVARADVCPNGISTVTVTENVGVYPVVVETFVGGDTTITIEGGITIIVSDAPTSITVTTSATITQTVTLGYVYDLVRKQNAC
jgi:hypothetical protein